MSCFVQNVEFNSFFIFTLLIFSTFIGGILHFFSIFFLCLCCLATETTSQWDLEVPDIYSAKAELKTEGSKPENQTVLPQRETNNLYRNALLGLTISFYAPKL